MCSRGSVRKGGDRLRITAPLIEAETGAHLWAEKFDGALDDIFDLQDQITERIVGVVEPSVLKSEIERSRRKPPDNLAAYDLYLRALPHMAVSMPPEARVAAQLLDDALRLDPTFAAAHAQLSHCHEICFFRDGFDPAVRNAGLAHARAALASGTDDALSLATAGFVVWVLGQDYESAVSAVERALSHNPCCTTALIWGAWLAGSGGDSARAIAWGERALRLSPFDPLVYLACSALGNTAIHDGRYEDAASHYGRGAQLNPHFSYIHVGHAVSLSLAGRAKEARAAARRALDLEPTFRFGQMVMILRSPTLAERFAAGARSAGLPE